MSNYNHQTYTRMSGYSDLYLENSLDTVFFYKFLPVSFNLKFAMISIVILLVLIQLLNSYKKHIVKSFGTQTVTNLNFIQATDLANIVSLVIVASFVIALYAFVTSGDGFTINSFLIILLLYLIPALLFPLLFVLLFSVSFLVCTGMIDPKSTLRAVINDCITIVSFTLRFFSQYIRQILIFVVFALLCEFVIETISLFNTNISSVSNNPIAVQLVSLVRLIFEIIDCFFILSVQFSAYFGILLWLLAFLFIIKLHNIYEDR